jgi:ubiquitin carboxyl-terminal hydrolase 10
MGQHEGGEAGGGTTPLIDATIRFLDEFACKDKSSPKHQSRKSARGKAREDEDGKKEGDSIHPFLSTYAYDAMKEKRQFITNRVLSSAHVVAFCY